MNKYNHTQIQESLENIRKPKLSSQVVDTAETRVWSKLSDSILKQSNMSTQTTPQKSNWSKFFTRPQMLLAGSTFVMLLVVSMVMIRFTLLNKPATNTNESVSIAELRTRADKKLSSLTNGVSLTTLKSAVQTVNAAEQKNNPAGVPATGQSNHGGATTFVNSEKAKEILEKEQIKDDVVFYTETEMKYLGDQDDGYMIYPGLDMTKPIVYKSWMSANYYKSITYHDGKMMDFYLTTPEYSLIYMGGKYAVKEIYTNNNYFGGFGFAGDNEFSPRNSEIEFLKYLLDESNQFKDLGMQTVDGKNLRVIEVGYDYVNYPMMPTDTYFEDGTMPADSVTGSEDVTTSNIVMPIGPDFEPTQTYNTRYYIDQEALSVYLTEEIIDGKVTSSTKNLASKTYSNEPLENFFNPTEIKNIEVREVVINYPLPEDFSLSSFIQTYDLFYIENVSTEYLSATDQAKFANYSNSDHYNDPDFNPRVTDQYPVEDIDNSYNYPAPMGYYFQESVSTEIFDQQPDYSQYLSGDAKMQNERQISINLNGQTVPAKYFEIVQNYPETSFGDEIWPASTQTNIFVEFQVGKYWYKVTTWQDATNPTANSLKPEGIKFTKLTPEKAKEIDDRMASGQHTEPYPNPAEQPTTNVIDLSEVSEDLLLLPGDLSQEYNLNVRSVNYYPNGAGAEMFNSKTCTIPECFRGFYRAVSFNFDDGTIYSVNDVKMDTLDFESLRRLHFAYCANCSEKEVPQFQTLENGIKTLELEGYGSYIFVPKGNKTIVIYTQLDRQTYLKIIANISDKNGFNAIQKQLKESNP